MGALLAGVAAPPARAAELTVTRTDDGGACSPGDCHLRGAVIAANASPEADTIVLPAGRYVLTRAGDDTTANAGDLDVLAAGGALTIAGAGARVTTIDAGGIPTLERAIETLTSSSLTISGLTVTGGDPDDDGAGISSRGTTTLEQVAVVGNHTDPGGLNDGGGIDNNGTMTIVDSLIAGNSSSAGGGGIEQDGVLSLLNVTISGNSTAGAEGGGGIDNDGDNAPVVAPGVQRGSLTVVNSTITANASAGAEGGGGITTEGGSSTAPATFRNAIVAGNTSSTGPPDCVTSGLHTSEGGNVGSAACGFTAGADRPGADPRLAGLGDNGGPTDTHALQPGSAAIVAGVGCPPPATDQRGTARPQGPACDSGAFEATAAPPGDPPPADPPRPPPPADPPPPPAPADPPPAAPAAPPPATSPPPPPPVTRPALPAFSRVVTLPTSRRCVSRRRFRIRIRRRAGLRYVSARVFVNGRRVRVVRGARLRAPVDLRGLPRGRFRVRIEVRLADGRTIRGTRRYRTCTPKRRSDRPPRL